MRTSWKGVVVLTTVVILGSACVSMAQDRRRGRGGFPGGGFGGFGGFGGGGVLALAERAEVQKSLGLSEDEKGYIALIREGVNEEMQNMRSKMENASREDRFRLMREMMSKQNEETESQLAEAIGKDKLTRLKQIEFQINGLRTLMFNQDLAQKLGINDEQRDAIRDASREVEEELNEIRRKKLEEKVLGLLSDSQKATYKEMAGEPIDFKLEPRRGGGPDGRRGGDGRRGRRGGDNN